MYATFFNHLTNSLRFLYGFVMLYMIVPRVLFGVTYPDDRLENMVSHYMRMTFDVIVMGYLLITLKIFEFIGLFTAMWIYIYIKKIALSDENKIKKQRIEIYLYFFDVVDGKKKPLKDLSNYFKVKFNHMKSEFGVFASEMWNVVEFLIILLILGYSAYIRFYDAFTSAVPAMSDGYVTLAWVKYIINRILFHDGIYPQGMHIYFGTLTKVAFINPLYTIKYGGPFNQLLIILGSYFLVSRVSGRKGLGILAMALYSIFSFILPIEFIRQAATNSQEFGYVFVFPTWYFTFRYLERSERRYLRSAFYGMAIAAMTHLVAFAFVAFGVALIVFSNALLRFKAGLSDNLKVVVTGIASGVVGILPLLLGMALGKTVHGSSYDYLTEEVSIPFPTLSNLETLLLLGFAVVLISVFIKIRRKGTELADVSIILIMIFGGITFIFGGYITQNLVIENRFTDLLIFETILASCYFAGIITTVVGKEMIKRVVETLVVAALLVVEIVVLKPEPIIPYKMEREASVVEYLQIEKSLRPTEWMMVSQDEGYALVYGTGYHLLMEDFLNRFDPDSEKLTDKETGLELKLKDVFIQLEKNVYRTDFENLVSLYDAREAQVPKIEAWVDEYGKTHDNMSVFYEDENFTIYRITQKLTRQTMFDNIWGTDENGKE